MLRLFGLFECCLIYVYPLQKTQNKRENFKSTYSGTGNSRVNTQGLQTSTFYQSVYHTQSQLNTGNAVDAPVQINGHILYPETMYKQLEHRASEQFKDINTLQKDLKDAKLQIDDMGNRLVNSRLKYIFIIKLLEFAYISIHICMVGS